MLSLAGRPPLRPEPARTRLRPTPSCKARFAQISKLSAGGAVTPNVLTNNDYNTNTLTYSPTGLDERNFYTGRIDYNLNEKNRFSLVYDYDFYGGFSDFLNNVVPVFPGTGAALGNHSPVGQSSNRFAGTLSWRTTITPNMTNELRGGLNGGTVLFFGQITPQMLTPWKGYNPGLGNIGTATLSGRHRDHWSATPQHPGERFFRHALMGEG